MRLSFAEPALPDKGVVVVGISHGGKLTPSAAKLDKKLKGAIGRAVKVGPLDGRKGETQIILAPAGLERASIVLIGLGKGAALDDLAWRSIGAKTYDALNAARCASGTVIVERIPRVKGAPADWAANLALGARLKSYRFDRYRTKEPKEKKPTLGRLTFMVEGAAAARRAYKPLEAVADGVDFTRDLVSEPGNVIYPASLAAACRKLAKLGVRVEVLGQRKLAELGFGALLGVGQGSAREPQVAVMRWSGGRRARKPLAFVGKGVTFDTGGISIKPSRGMAEMKWDMGGAGAVIGALHALAARKAKANVVGVVGLVENMPSGTAQRPGDIVTSLSGQTIEVLDTDAEGRLVLADALWYTQKRFKPEAIVDLATLTGAIMVALGREHAGLFANDDGLAAKLTAAGKAVGEPLWRMPLGEAYDRQINTDAADVRNLGTARWGGSITAAQFLQRFTGDVPWAHLDIAGMAWSDKTRPTMEKGATAFGVQLIDRLVRDNYES